MVEASKNKNVGALESNWAAYKGKEPCINSECFVWDNKDLAKVNY